MATGFMEIFQLGIGVYVLYAALTNSEKLFEFSGFQFEDEEKVRRTLRALYLAIGSLAALDGLIGMARNYLFASENPPQIALPAFITYDLLMTINWCMLGSVLALIVVVYVYMRKNSTKK